MTSWSRFRRRDSCALHAHPSGDTAVLLEGLQRAGASCPFSEQESDSVEVRFDDTTLTLKTLALHMYHHGEQITAQWPGASGSAGFAWLTSPSPHRYVVAADVPASGSGRRLSLLIEFDC